MGIRGFTSNKKRSIKSSKSQRWHRQCKAEKKKILPKETLEIEDLHLFSTEKLKNKLRNPTNNIKISGKKRRRLTKRLGHSVREKSQMEIEVIDEGPKSKKLAQTTDVKMSNNDSEEETVQASSSSLPSLSSAPRKKKRGGKKYKKRTSSGKDSSSLFEQNDGWEDVEMGDG